METIENFSDNDLIREHRKIERIANILHQGIKNGIDNAFWNGLHDRVIMFLHRINAEYYRRHPEAKDKHTRELFAFADMLIEQSDKAEFGDRNFYQQQIQVEYHQPEPGQKKVTTSYQKDPEGNIEHLEIELKMTESDFLSADLEKALDEIAKSLPDTPAEK